MKANAKLLTAPAYVPRPELEQAIVTAARSRARLLLHGRMGSGRRTVLQHALGAAGHDVFTVDLAGVLQLSDLDAAFSRGERGRRFTAALLAHDAHAKRRRSALVICNLDGCRGVADEAVIAGALRSELQAVQHLSVFYTTADSGFVSRHVNDLRGAFFKQCERLDIPDLHPSAVDTLALLFTGSLMSDRAKGLLVDSVGLKAGDLASFFSRLAGGRGPRGEGKAGAAAEAPSADEVMRLLRVVASERKGAYDIFVHSFLTAHLRAVLSTFARGVPLKASSAMAEGSGVPVKSLGSTIARLKENGCLIDVAGEWRFADPFLRLHLLENGL